MLQTYCGEHMVGFEDKKRGANHPKYLFRRFCNVIEECGLTNMSLLSYPYTWLRKEDGIIVLEERIDRALVNPS